ncbi:MAG: c-type cytochrome [Thiobacillus sp.]|nr:c-type cytochrome [Thiobacillus sp.]
MIRSEHYMSYRSFVVLTALSLALGACSQPPVVGTFDQTATSALKSGEQVYQNVCIACHSTGVANAPKSGDGERWRELIAEGQSVVTAHGWVGLRGMPPRGGQPDLTLEEFARAVAWMARSSGATWQDPDAALMAEIRKEEKKRIEELGNKSQLDDASYRP